MRTRIVSMSIWTLEALKDEKKTKQLIHDKWDEILERMLIIDKIDSQLTSSKIGMIEVKNLSPSDSQKIFNIINSEGERLKAVEILSAKPHWNIPIINPSQEAIDAVKELYKELETVPSDVVRWDYPATILRRLGTNCVIKQFAPTKTDFVKELTCGFKIVAGIYEGGVKKESIEKLSKSTALNWNKDFDQLIYDLKNMFKLLTSYDYFRYFQSWRATIFELTSEAVAIDFFVIAYKDWERKGKPIGSDIKARQFQKNCFILWDKLIYEYIYKQWRGAADQKTAYNISNLSNEPDVFESVSQENWQRVLKEIFEESTIDSLAISQTLMTPLLYHKDLVAFWRTMDDKRFQNYEAYFTVLETEKPISRKWLEALIYNHDDSLQYAPDVWKKFISEGRNGIVPLIAKKLPKIPTKYDQLQSDVEGTKCLSMIRDHYQDNPYGFENCAKNILEKMDERFQDFSLTRPWRDGGRDALGYYVIGGQSKANYPLRIDCAMEAKCYSENHSVGVREMSRLISRIRYRQFGVVFIREVLLQKC